MAEGLQAHGQVQETSPRVYEGMAKNSPIDRETEENATRTQQTLQRAQEGKGGRIDMEKIFPTILIALDFLASIPYAVKCDLKMTVYWIAAGVLTFSVTWM